MAYLNLTGNATSARLKTQSLQIETYERSTSEEAEKSFCAPETIPGASSLTPSPLKCPLLPLGWNNSQEKHCFPY